MSAININTFTTGTFDFYVGPEKTRFVIHKALVSRFSLPLEKMMTNGMKETQEGAAYFEHVDVGTFGRFAEYIYTGDYSSAAPKEVPLPCKEEAVVQRDDIQPEMASGTYVVPWARPSPHSPKKRKKVVGRRDEPLQVATASTPEQPAPFPIDPPPGRNSRPSVSYTTVFTSHVAVYYFAKQYFIHSLGDLAKQKFFDALNNFECYLERAEDICHAIRSVYEHEDSTSTAFSLQNIVLDYASDNFRVLTESTVFKALLAEGGSFAPDLCSKVADSM